MARHGDGTSRHFTNGTTWSPTTSQVLTLACWYKPNAASSTQVVLSLLQNNVTWYGFYLQQSSSNQLAAVAVHNNTFKSATITSPSLSTGTWYHFAGVFNGSTSRKAYLNGGTPVENTDSLSTPTTLRTGALAAYKDSAAVWANGAIAEIGIYDAALTADEVSALASGYSPLMVRPKALRSYYPMDCRGGDASNEVDWVGGYALTQVSSPYKSDSPRIIYGAREIWSPNSVAASIPTLTALSISGITTSGATLTVSA